MKNKKETPLGLSQPKSQGSPTQSKTIQDKEEQQKQENQPSSGSGSGGESSSKKQKKKEKKRLLEQTELPQKQPLSSKVYDLINKGYLRETQPW